MLQAVRLDRRAIPRTGERVPYVVVYGEPGLPLIQELLAAILSLVAAILSLIAAILSLVAFILK
jgi:hypothetical protein